MCYLCGDCEEADYNAVYMFIVATKSCRTLVCGAFVSFVLSHMLLGLTGLNQPNCSQPA
jgi:hypothetical protein